jgi:(2Fe-2S) ferredoxin
MCQLIGAFCSICCQDKPTLCVRIARVLRALIAEMDQQFGREVLNSEIERLALFADDDPI